MSNSSPVTGGYAVDLYCDGYYHRAVASTLGEANAEAYALAQLSANTGKKCSSSSHRWITGGYVVDLYCDGYYHTAAAANLTLASYEARALAALSAATGKKCTGSSQRSISGGYVIDLYCDGYYHTAAGDTLTDATAESRALAQLAVNTGKKCTGSSQRSISGGYVVDLYCDGHYHTAAATYLTTASYEARALAILGVTTGKECTYASQRSVTGGYVVDLYCGGDYHSAAGTTLTEAMVESRALAQLAANTGKRCTYASHRAVSGGYSVDLYCAGVYHTAVGSTVTDASRWARALA
ncbi:hypothetical protein GCM10010483_46260 [Actinokineospora diospyrosa]